MTEKCQQHEGHGHTHGPGCGHTAVKHDGHADYLHDGHLHNVHGDHVDEHAIGSTTVNRSDCTPNHGCGGHEKDHVHGPTCGHERVPHAGHTDFLVKGHLHHPHDGHCDDHGPLERWA